MKKSMGKCWKIIGLPGKFGKKNPGHFCYQVKVIKENGEFT